MYEGEFSKAATLADPRHKLVIHVDLPHKKVCFYIAQYPVRWTAQSGRPVHPGTNSTSLGSIQPCCNYARRLSTTVYSQVLIYTDEWTEASWRELKCPNVETVAKGIRTRARFIASSEFYCRATGLHMDHLKLRDMLCSIKKKFVFDHES